MESYKKNYIIELTVTDACNCNCKYCFEHDHASHSNKDEEIRQLELIKDLCQQLMLKDDCRSLNISFWGGEPILNLGFICKIILATYKYKFITYHLYSNGTLQAEYVKFLKMPFIDSIKNRFHIQLSYDGEPHHSEKRSYDKQLVFNTAKMLIAAGFNVDFKATLTYDMIPYLPQIWESYEHLYEIFGRYFTYSPTLDTESMVKCSNNEIFNDWKNSINVIAKKEYSFITKNGFPLSRLFKLNESKFKCNLNDSVFMHTDGKIYACHGCPYIINNKKFILCTTKETISLMNLFDSRKKFILDSPGCFDCCANYCAMCHIMHLDGIDNIYKNWGSCISNNIDKCMFYKYLGFVSKLLKYELLKNVNI
jgi:sulfatase maturation enzyme AslB (radical SAM superfamily)